MVANLRDETQFLIVVPRFDVRPGPFCDLGNLVHESDLGGEHGFGRLFGQLRRADVHRDETLVAAVERRVEVAQKLPGARIVHADGSELVEAQNRPPR